ncbi:MAG TPA: hypothetical protein VEF72_28895 [Mycobacterium sp.]|nr:hypothetical protein [Mycobacterium sp.]
MAEQWILAGCCVVVLDPEGDQTDLQELNQVRVVDARHYLPEPPVGYAFGPELTQHVVYNLPDPRRQARPEPHL